MRDDDRKQILARRSRMLALALAAGTTSITATACACLRLVPPDAGVDAPTADGGVNQDAPESDAGE